jgi:hypothetical protein
MGFLVRWGDRPGGRCPDLRIQAFTFVLVEPESADRQVAPQVGLLVDGELDAAVLDGLDEVLVEVEGRDLGLAARIRHRP